MFVYFYMYFRIRTQQYYIWNKQTLSHIVLLCTDSKVHIKVHNNTIYETNKHFHIIASWNFDSSKTQKIMSRDMYLYFTKYRNMVNFLSRLDFRSVKQNKITIFPKFVKKYHINTWKFKKQAIFYDLNVSFLLK